MSVPNIGHLEAQRGGYCTVSLLHREPSGTPPHHDQDYSLFHILRDYRLDLWKLQAAGVTARHGLVAVSSSTRTISWKRRPKNTYQRLLEFLCQCRTERRMWLTTPKELNSWWRLRSRLNLVERHGAWRIEGPGSERAQIAYAGINGGRIVYTRDGL